MKVKNTVIKVVVPVISAVLAFLIGALLILVAGSSPVEAFGYLFKGAFGNMYSVGSTLVKATPLIFTGLAATFAYKCGVFNLGAEGQFIIGACASVGFSTAFASLPGIVNLILSLVLGAVAGSLWGAIPGLLKVYRGLNEMITSILLNYVATLFMGYLFTGPLMESNIPQTAAVPENTKLFKVIPGTSVHIGIIIALIVALGIYYFLFHTSKGFQLRAVGLNANAAMVNGFSIKKFMLMSFIVSGAIAGLGGSIELHGTSYRLMSGFGQGFGFDGVAIALIGQLNPIGTVIAAYFFAVLRTGANTMQVGAGIPTAVVDIIQGLIIIFVVASTAMLHLPQIKQFISNRSKKSRKVA